MKHWLQLHRTPGDWILDFSSRNSCLAKFLEDKGKLQEAAAAYEKAKSALPSPVRLAMLACLDVRLGKTAEARRDSS